jgi:plastocyanin
MRFGVPVVMMAILLAAPLAPAAEIAVDVSGIEFSQKKITAHVGDKITWTNKDFVAHTATARNGDWDVALPVKGSGSVVLKKAGHIDYYCKVHPTMKGEIDVK